MDPSLLPPDDGTEPDMECDPTLASCCQREIRDRRTQQAKLDAIRSVMPASVLPPTMFEPIEDSAARTPRRKLIRNVSVAVAAAGAVAAAAVVAAGAAVQL